MLNEINAPETLKMPLNQEQLAAVHFASNQLLLVAGAGTGKTTVITERIAWLIQEKTFKPEEIVALTFTEKASTEMAERLDCILPLGTWGVTVNTFHKFSENLLREYGLHLGWASNFQRLAETDAMLLLRRHSLRFGFWTPFLESGPSPKLIKELYGAISGLREAGFTGESYRNYLESKKFTDLWRGDAEAKIDATLRGEELARALDEFSLMLRETQCLDFAGLLLESRDVLRKVPSVRKLVRERYRYFLVDEFQDTNPLQFELLKELTGADGCVLVVGDDDQAIYGFRGATVDNILQFRTAYPQAKSLTLVKNYRSGQAILNSAYKLIQSNNPNRLEVIEKLDKRLIATSNTISAQVEAWMLPSGDGEVEWVRSRIDELLKGGVQLQEIAILARAHDHLIPFKTALERSGWPVYTQGGDKLLREPLIMDLIAALRVIIEPFHNLSVFSLLINKTIGVGETIAVVINHIAKREASPIWTVLQKILLPSFTHRVGEEISPEAINKIARLVAKINEWREELKLHEPTAIILKVLKESGIITQVLILPEVEQMLIFSKLNGFLRRVDDWKKRALDKSLRDFLEEIRAAEELGEETIIEDLQASPEAIQLLTVHSAKGLEFEYVFIVNAVEQRFPGNSRGEKWYLPVSGEDARIKNLSEERRLFYVAMTRAKQGLMITGASSYGGVRARRPSVFINEAGIELETIPVVAPEGWANQLLDPVKAPANHDLLEAPLIGTQAKTEPVLLSFSQLMAFENCPLQYRYAHVIGVPSWQKPMVTFGQSVHAALHDYLELLRSGEAVTPGMSTLRPLYERAFIGDWYPSVEVRVQRFEQGIEALNKFLISLEANPPQVLALEQPFYLQIAGFQLQGKIDRIDELSSGGVEVIDYKTGGIKEQLGWKDKRQLLLYAMAVNALYPTKTVERLSYHYVIGGQTVSFVPKASDFERLEEDFRALGEGIERGIFEPTPDVRVCGNCDFHEICPSAKLG